MWKLPKPWPCKAAENKVAESWQCGFDEGYAKALTDWEEAEPPQTEAPLTRWLHGCDMLLRVEQHDFAALLFSWIQV